ncbi:unnamed protein product [Urochloa decumbens]|uniref:Rx N-terminal domain-containing protein n=1 Tax=Urochloa decumbens TaxID=240449 RepID=A0ABC9B4Q3_9POAL
MEIAVSAARWVVGKALAPVMDGLLEAWAASAGLSPNIDSLKMELLYVQAMLDNSRGREIRSPALQELLHKLRQLAYDAEDVLDELDYFRIQDQLQGTYETTGDDVDARGAIRDLRHAAKAVAKQLVGLCSCGSRPAASLTSDDDDDGEPGQQEAVCCVCAACWKMARRNASLSHTVRNAGKLFPFRSFLPAESSGMMDPITPAPRLEFDRVEMSKRMKAIVDELKPLCKKVSTILNLDLLDSNRSIAQDIAANLLTERGRTPLLPPKNIAKSRSITTSDIMEPNFYGREIETNKVIDIITKGDDCCVNDLTVIPIVGLGGMGKTTLAHDYEFSRWELVQWWIGLDILPSYGHGKNNEDIGKNCLNDLVDHGFFKEDKMYGTPRYIIHDLLRDLGLNTASRECLSKDHANVGSVEIWPSVRHLSIIIDGADGSDGIITDENFLRELRVLKKKLKVENLQTLMIFGKQDECFNSFLRWLILKANGLRVLHLSEMIPHMEFSALHLRYLRLGRINTREMHLPSMLDFIF